MASDLIRYDILVQNALRSVLRKVLMDAARVGLPGDHHFFITFRTGANGVRLSSAMRARYPEEMTIILQHQFWDLSVSDHGFEVGLSFANVPERLLVPFDAVTGFFDPSVEFGLKFELQTEETENDASGARLPGDKSKAATKPASKSAPVTKTHSLKPVGAVPPAATNEQGYPSPRGAGSEPAVLPQPAKTEVKKEDTSGGDAKVISIDAFRKKP